MKVLDAEAPGSPDDRSRGKAMVAHLKDTTWLPSHSEIEKIWHHERDLKSHVYISGCTRSRNRA